MATLELLCLIIGICIAGIGCVVGMVRPSKRRWLQASQVITLSAALGAFITLCYAMLTGDTTLAYVAHYRAPAAASWGIRVAAVWAGQSGGLLLWCLEESIVALFVSANFQPRAVALLLGLRAILFTLILINNPFAIAAKPVVGGLNPMLNSSLMVIHPPMLFLGYAILTIPYAITLGALLDGIPQQWIPRVRPWLLVAWLALTAGNGFGALWAYRTFGWGGFWSWDPVENTSFVPWMLVTMAVHGGYIARRYASGARWMAICAMAAFISVLYGSFLARSGLLGNASIHAYTADEHFLSWALGVLILITIAMSATGLAIRWKQWGGFNKIKRGYAIVPRNSHCTLGHERHCAYRSGRYIVTDHTGYFIDR